MLRFTSQSYGNCVCGRPTDEGDEVIARVVGRGKYVTAESPPFLKSLANVFNTVHQFIPFNVPSDTLFHTLYALSRPSLRMTMVSCPRECRSIVPEFCYEWCFCSVSRRKQRDLLSVRACNQPIRHHSSTSCGEVHAVGLISVLFSVS
jgi:hypothetical protein